MFKVVQLYLDSVWDVQSRKLESVLRRKQTLLYQVCAQHRLHRSLGSHSLLHAHALTSTFFRRRPAAVAVGERAASHQQSGEA